MIGRTENGTTTAYSYEPLRNLEIKQVVGLGTEDSTIIINEWDINLPVKTKVTEGSANPDGSLKQTLRITSYTHDARGNILTKTITDSITSQTRQWQYTYNNYSQKISETTPLGLTQTWAYDPSNGHMLSLTTTSYSNYSSDGKPQTITAPSGQTITLTYDAAGRMLSQMHTIMQPELKNLAQAENGWIEFQNWWRKLFRISLLPNPIAHDITKQSSQMSVTRYEYDPVGQLIKTTLPDGDAISYSYDDAHRLIATNDSLGNQITYTLNGAGEIIQTDRYDPQGILAQTSKQIFDNLGHVIN